MFNKGSHSFQKLQVWLVKLLTESLVKLWFWTRIAEIWVFSASVILKGGWYKTLLAKQFLLIFHHITPIFLFQKAAVLPKFCAVHLPLSWETPPVDVDEKRTWEKLWD